MGRTASNGRQSELGKVTLAVDRCGHSIFIARTSISSLKGRILTCRTRGTPEFGCQSLDLNLNTAKHLEVLLNLIGIVRKTNSRKHSVIGVGERLRATKTCPNREQGFVRIWKHLCSVSCT
jgi:hypothetical protein